METGNSFISPEKKGLFSRFIKVVVVNGFKY